MPYIEPERQERIALPYVGSTGELTFAIDKIAEELLWKLSGYDWAKVRYEHLAAIDGALGLAQFEFRRRVVAPYEDAKREQNGDIFIFPHPEQWDERITDDVTDLIEEPVVTLTVVPNEVEAS